MDHSFSFTLNGTEVHVEGESPCTTLLSYLRASGLTGTKEGCAEGDCGACSVGIVDNDADGHTRLRVVNSCLMLLPAVAGRHVVTVEGLAHSGAIDTLHPVQQSLVETGGSQCGYCTPGFVMSLIEAYYRDDGEDQAAIDDQLCGNLCRCTGYRPIRDAAQIAVSTRRKNKLKGGTEPLAKLLGQPTRALSPLRYEGPGGRFERPTTLSDLLDTLAAEPEARVLAGGTDIGLEITKEFKHPKVLVSTEAVPELTELGKTAEAWHVGSAVTLSRLEEALGKDLPSLRSMLSVFGSRQIRNRATLGGNLATASPIGDLAPVLMSLDASVVLAATSGERALSLEDFITSYRRTALRSGEVVLRFVIPRGATAPDRRRLARSYKVSKRREMDISIVSAAFAVDLDPQETICYARLVYGGVAPTTARARDAEEALLNRKLDADTLRAVRPIVARAFTPISDHRGSAAYRLKLIPSLLNRFFHEEGKL
ncbi:xanthine dehydrogenase small subunit [Planctomycetota bacterium]